MIYNTTAVGQYLVPFAAVTALCASLAFGIYRRAWWWPFAAGCAAGIFSFFVPLTLGIPLSMGAVATRIGGYVAVCLVTYLIGRWLPARSIS